MSFIILPGVITPPLTPGAVPYGTGSNVLMTAQGSVNQILKSQGASAPIWVSDAEKTWTAFTSSGTYTVPTGIDSIRVYAFGKGGNGVGAAAAASASGGGGGGCAFGDLAVTAGQLVSITIAAGVATVDYAGTTRYTANPGADGSGGTGGAGGSASIDVSVTNGGAYTGGSGGNSGGGGGSSGSPLGNGYAGSSNGGGGGWGGVGNFGGGGVGGAGNSGGGGSGGAAISNQASEYAGGISRDIYRLFSDPLLADCNAPGGMFNWIATNFLSASGNGGPGAGGGYASNSVGSAQVYSGNGGIGGGGGRVSAGGVGSSGYAGDSTLGGGGGAAEARTTAQGGSPVYAGGGGAAWRGTTNTAGIGGAAIVLIYA